MFKPISEGTVVGYVMLPLDFANCLGGKRAAPLAEMSRSFPNMFHSSVVLNLCPSLLHVTYMGTIVLLK